MVKEYWILSLLTPIVWRHEILFNISILIRFWASLNPLCNFISNLFSQHLFETELLFLGCNWITYIGVWHRVCLNVHIKYIKILSSWKHIIAFSCVYWSPVEEVYVWLNYPILSILIQNWFLAWLPSNMKVWCPLSISY